MTDTQTTWLTQESYDRLKAELDQLIANRPVIAAEINDRREEGDLRENGGYHAAREEQGQQEARIRQLQELLNNAKVGEAPKQSGVALPGSVVKVYYDGDETDTETFLIGTREQGVNGGEPRGVLAPFPAGRRPDRRQGRRYPHLHRAQRQHRQGHPGQRGALPLLAPTRSAAAHGANRRGPAATAVGQRRSTARTGRIAPAASAQCRAPAGSGAHLSHPTVRTWRSGPAGLSGGADGPGSRRPGAGARPAGCCHVSRRRRPTRSPSCAAGSSPSCWSTWRAAATFERIRLYTNGFRRQEAWTLTDRGRPAAARAAMMSALLDGRTARSADSGDHLAAAHRRRLARAAVPGRSAAGSGSMAGRPKSQAAVG